MYDAAPLPPTHYENVDKASPEQELTKQLAVDSMQQLHGWCSDFKGQTLMDLVWDKKPEIIVEIGVFGGKSLVPMAYALKLLGSGVAYGIDPWCSLASAEGMDGVNKDWWGNLDHNAILSHLEEKIENFELGEYITLIRATSEEAAPIANIDILHIDGNHSEEASFLDTIKWVSLVRKGGMIIFDDITWGTTTKATDWLDNNCSRMQTIQDEANEWAIWIK